MEFVRPYKPVSSIGRLVTATQSARERNPDVVVVGAGYAGLAAATRLRERGLRVLVLEARDRVGGRARSERLANGEIAELGGEWIFEGYDELLGLARRSGLGLVEMGVDFARRTAADVDAPLEAQDTLVERLREEIEAVPPAELDGATLGAFLDGQSPGPALEALTARFLGTCATPLDQVALRTAFEEGLLRPGGAGPSWRLADGNQRLAERLARDVEVRHGAGVAAVEQVEGSVRVVGQGFGVEAAAAIVAVPLPLLREIAFEPAMPTTIRAAVDALGFGVAAKLAVPTRRTLEPRARQSVSGPFWWWVSRGEGGAPRGVVTAYAGSPVARDDLETSSGDPRTWLERLTALEPEVDPVGEAVLADWGSERWTGGAYTSIPPGAADRMPELAEPFGRVVLAGEHTAGASWHGTLEGALRSGRRAAEQVAVLLAG